MEVPIHQHEDSKSSGPRKDIFTGVAGNQERVLYEELHTLVQTVVLTAVVTRELGLPESRHTFDNIWRSVVPPRVELFGWFVVLGRLNTLDRSAVNVGEVGGTRLEQVGEHSVVAWLCVEFMHDKQCLAFGGYIMNGMNAVWAVGCDYRSTGSNLEALIDGVELFIQLTLEESLGPIDRLMIVTVEQSLINWYKDKDDGLWSLNFHKNKFKNLLECFGPICVQFASKKEFWWINA
ncbi:hypothetical protein PIB30_071523 [Stylosanthes scabra]|uniref:Uncharacterized protein n=1 Tax=Stylosanthes scabra TaxID=79078 RepID=A0ABU6ZML9_9FABA|nr:hypothetical protein [Stylosanthes scabra]